MGRGRKRKPLISANLGPIPEVGRALRCAPPDFTQSASISGSERRILHSALRTPYVDGGEGRGEESKESVLVDTLSCTRRQLPQPSYQPRMVRKRVILWSSTIALRKCPLVIRCHREESPSQHDPDDEAST